MPMFRAFLVFFAIFKPLHATHYPVRLGDTTVTIETMHRGEGKNFVHLHQNETTALQAAKAVVRSKGGSVLTLIHPGQRNIEFNLNGKHCEFDPNRIFTDVGIKKTLSDHGDYSVQSHAAVKKFADKIKSLIPRGKVIAVHNNHDYSIKEYLPGHSYENDASALHLDKNTFYRNFYLVTQHADFERLKNLNFNIVLQIEHATNDGSLSVFMAKKDYVNVEAGYGQLASQIKMLKYA